MVPGVYVLTSCAVPLNETSNPAAINPFFIFLYSIIYVSKYSYSFVNLPFVSVNFFHAAGNASIRSLEVVPISPFSSAAMSPALEIAGQLLRGEVSAMGCICDGSIAMSGMVNMIDNVNRILDRVSIYLA